jgi:DNA-binding transcriptional LysR family regulator
MRLPDPMHIRAWLTGGECELAVGYFPALPDGLRGAILFRDALACVAARDHPEIGATLSLAQFAAAHNVVFGSPFSPLSTLEMMFDQVLASAGVQRRLGMRVASVLLLSYVVAQTPLLAVLPQVFARHFATFLPLRVLAAPFEVPPVEISMVWHERSHRVSMHRQVREVVRQVVAEHLATAPAPGA